MADDQTYASIPGHVPVKVAAMLLSLSQERVLQHVRAGRLPARTIAGRYFIPLPAVEAFQRQPHGRIRTKPVHWRIYRAGARLHLLHVRGIVVREGQEASLAEHLQVVMQTQQHLFPGTRDRFLCWNHADRRHMDLYLFWKDTELRDQRRLYEDLAQFQSVFGVWLDWTDASLVLTEVLAHT
jgi:hypothetical protein